MLVDKNTKIYYGNTEIKKIYLGSNLVWQRQTMDESTLAIINYANANGYALPSNLTALDNLIKGMKSSGIWALLDRFWLFSGDGSTDFKRINLIDVSKTRADFYGGLTINASGIKGNGTNAYVDTNFNPSLLESGQKYQLNNASFGILNSTVSNTFANNILSGTGNSATVQTLYNRSTVIHRINSNAVSYSSNIDFTGIGLKILNRISELQIVGFSNGTNYVRDSNSTSILNANIFLIRKASEYGDSTISCYFIGSSIPFQVSQDFRTVFNTYLSAIGQTPIA